MTDILPVMHILEKPSKYYLRQQVSALLEQNPTMSMLDIGCGRAQTFLSLFEKYTGATYIGLEPFEPVAEQAREICSNVPNMTIRSGFGYKDQDAHSELASSFDIVVSLSVLEHVKQLEKFLEFSCFCTAPGGTNIHLYDLGHALYPHCIVERIQVAVCGTPMLKRCVPETKFCCYVDQKYVRSFLEKQGMNIQQTTYHNMPNHVALLKGAAKDANPDLLSKLANTEVHMAKDFQGSQAEQEKLFPSICIWSSKT